MTRAGRQTLQEAARALLEAASTPTPAKLARAAKCAGRAARALAFAGFKD